MKKIERIRAMLTADPKNPFVWYSLALEERKDDKAAARATFARIVSEFPDYVPAHHQYGALLLELGDPAAAREALLRGLGAADRAGDGHARAEMEALLART